MHKTTHVKSISETFLKAEASAWLTCHVTTITMAVALTPVSMIIIQISGNK
jgi:hypothetical protein